MANKSSAASRALVGLLAGGAVCFAGSLLARLAMVQDAAFGEWRQLLALAALGGVVCGLGRAIADSVAGAVLGAMAGMFLGGAVSAALPEWRLQFEAEEKFVPPSKPFELRGPGLDGQPVDVADYKGKVVLVDFWATWCPPCKAEIPHILAAYNKYHDQGFDVIAVSADRSRDELRNFVEDKQLPWKQIYFDERPNPLEKQHRIEFYPTTFLIDREGRVAATNLRGSDLSTAVGRLIEGETPSTGTKVSMRSVSVTPYICMLVTSLAFAVVGALFQRFATVPEAPAP